MTIISNYKCDNCSKIAEKFGRRVFLTTEDNDLTTQQLLDFCSTKCFKEYVLNIRE